MSPANGDCYRQLTPQNVFHASMSLLPPAHDTMLHATSGEYMQLCEKKTGLLQKFVRNLLVRKRKGIFHYQRSQNTLTFKNNNFLLLPTTSLKPCYRHSQTFCNDVSKSSPITGLDRPLGFQEVEAPRISRQPAHECGRVVSPTRLYTQEVCLVFIYVRV